MKYYIKGSLNISAHLSMKIILVDPNLVRTHFGNIFLILIIVRTLENNYFLVRTKLGYLRYIFHRSLLFAYFYFRTTYPKKADLTEQYNNMELQTFRKVVFLACKCFFRFQWLRMKKFKIIIVRFHPKLIVDKIN